MVLPASCFNCKKPRPANLLPSAQGFRCFHCGATNGSPTAPAQAPAQAPDARDAPDASPLALESSPPKTRAPARAHAPQTGRARQLAPFQAVAVENRGRTVLQLLLLAVLVLAPCAYAAYVLWSLRELNDKQLLATMAGAPLLALVLPLLFGLWRIGAARRPLEDLLAAIASPRGGPPLCYTCGAAMRGTDLLERCRGCGCDCVVAASVVRRAGKTESSRFQDRDRPIGDEVAHRYEALDGAILGARTAVVVLPLLALMFSGAVWWKREWRVPSTDRRKYAVISAKRCPMVVVTASMIDDGLVEVRTKVRDASLQGPQPVAINRLFSVDDFVGLEGKAPASGQKGKIIGVYQLHGSDEIRVALDLGDSEEQAPLSRLCMVVDKPYRDVKGLSQEQLAEQAARKAAAAEAKKTKARALAEMDAQRELERKRARARGRNTNITIYGQ